MSALLAKSLGAFIVILGLALYFNRKNLNVMYGLTKGKEYLFLSGIVNLIVGILIVFNHNIWTSDWRLVVTLMGWIAVFKGLIRVLKPELVKSSVSRIKSDKMFFNVVFVGVMVLGLYLLYVGFTMPMGSFF